MKSLPEREAFRAKQKENEAKLREKAGAKPVETAESFSAADYVSGTVQKVSGGLGDLDDAQLDEVAAAEAGGKNRASINDAIATEKKKREASAGSWGSNK